MGSFLCCSFEKKLTSIGRTDSSKSTQSFLSDDTVYENESEKAENVTIGIPDTRNNNQKNNETVSITFFLCFVIIICVFLIL